MQEEKVATEEKKKSEDESTKKTVKKMKDSLEKTTLGDISALANLKQEMDKKGDKK
jgi:small subunit ribosomal protein S1